MGMLHRWQELYIKEAFSPLEVEVKGVQMLEGLVEREILLLGCFGRAT